ncbi:MAG: signal peptidase I [Promethearchaeota archaeon]|nr:MAG: signal peptidase I [Candidatus Lokiarchaeota archaeon]
MIRFEHRTTDLLVMEKHYLKMGSDKKHLKKKQSSSKRKIIIGIILIALAFSGSFLIYFIMQVTLNTQVPMVVVVSGSMEPTLLKGDLLFLQGKDPSLIKNGTIEGKEGDIIVFNAVGLPGWPNAPADPIVHRVINKKYDNGWFFQTKGDANPLPDDDWVPANRIFGIVIGRIPYIGWVKILLTDSGLLLPLLIIVSALLIISIIWDIVKKEHGIIDKKQGEKELIYNPKAKTKEEVREIEINFTESN